MIVKLAKVYGFCSGVRKSVELASRLLEENKGKACYSIGPIVHNSNLVRDFEKKGLRVIKTPDDAEGGVALVRAHGLPGAAFAAFEAKGFDLVDGTCPVVRRSQRLAAAAEGPVLMFGVKKHAEVEGVVSRVKDKAFVISEVEDISALDPSLSYTGIVQTTFSSSKLEAMKTALRNAGINVNYVNAICSASRQRREAVRDLSKETDGIVVVGDRGSSNTLELYRLAQECSARAWLIPDAGGILPEMRECGTIGLTAGASVSDENVNEVRRRLEEL